MKNFTLFSRASILIFILIITNSVLAQKKVTLFPKIGLDFIGNHNVIGFGDRGELDVNNGITFGLDVLTRAGNNLNIGMGLMYQLPREQEVEGSGKFNFLPVYGIAQFRLSNKSDKLIPHLLFHIGYNALFSGEDSYKGSFDLSGGFYLAGGFQFQTKRLVFEVMYRTLSGSAESLNNLAQTNDSFDVTYSYFSVMVGIFI